MNPLALTWSTATPELSNHTRQIAIHVINHDLASPVSVNRTIRFVTARIAYFSTQLPKGWQQAIRIDDRGQEMAPSERERLRSALAPHSVSFFTEPMPAWLITS